jgi:serine protease Do
MISLPSIAVAESGDGGVFNAISAKIQEVFERSQKAVVKIEGTDRHGKLSGTGFFIDPNGTLYTSYTIGGTARDLIVVKDAMRYPATRLIGDPRSGIAILKIEAETSYLPLGTTHGLKPTSPVVKIGYPMAFPLSPSFGIVAGMDLRHEGRFFRTSHIRANVPVQRGEGGAPMLNLDGEVVGILISSIDSGSGCFALPIDAAEKVRKDFVRFGELRPGWLGVNVVERHAGATGGSSALVTEVVEGAPGEGAGLKPGDYLVRIGKTQIASPEDILDASFFLTSGDVTPMVVSRDGKLIELQVKPSDPPERKGDPLQLVVPRPEETPGLDATPDFGGGRAVNFE